jgi:hypothetical protein
MKVFMVNQTRYFRITFEDLDVQNRQSYKILQQIRWAREFPEQGWQETLLGAYKLMLPARMYTGGPSAQPNFKIAFQYQVYSKL